MDNMSEDLLLMLVACIVLAVTIFIWSLPSDSRYCSKCGTKMLDFECGDKCSICDLCEEKW